MMCGALRRDLDMADLIAERNVPVILMHNRSKPQDAAFEARLGGRYTGSQYDDLIPDIQRELQECVDLARAAGVPDWQIILDPGIGFGKTVSQNLELLDRVGEFKALGFPILIGPSRKSFIGYTLNLPPDQRVEGTAAAVAIGIARGADIVRVHDVEAMARVAKMTDAIVRDKDLQVRTFRLQGGDGWESNPPLLALRDRPTVLKTVAATGPQPPPCAAAIIPGAGAKVKRAGFDLSRHSMIYFAAQDVVT